MSYLLSCATRYSRSHTATVDGRWGPGDSSRGYGYEARLRGLEPGE